MENKSRKRLSWTLSFVIHAVGLVLILVAGFHIAAPDGTVTDKTEFSAVDFTPAAPPASQPAPPPPQQVQPAQPVAEEPNPPAEAPQQKEAPPQEAPVDEAPVDEAPKVAQEPVTQESDDAPKLAEGDHQDADAEDPAQAPEESASAPQAQSEVQPQTQAQAPVPEATAVESPVAIQSPAPTEGAPAYGTPGTMLDESKLVEAFGNHKPSYPWMARLRRQEGTVVLRAFVKKDGEVDQVTVEKSSGSSLIDEEARTSYARWRYKEGPSGWVLKPFKFTLK